MAGNLDISGLHQVALTTSDLDRSARFYGETLGLRLIAVFDPPGLAFFDLDGIRLSVQRVDEAPESSSVIYLRVPDIDAAVGMLKNADVAFERGPELVFSDTEGQFGAAGEEEWMAFLRDPDGHLLALVSRRPGCE